jgi:hypothetical protein
MGDGRGVVKLKPDPKQLLFSLPGTEKEEDIWHAARMKPN